MEIRNRIKELRQVNASELLPNPKNWRRHPGAQADALRGALAEIGHADAIHQRADADANELHQEPNWLSLPRVQNFIKISKPKEREPWKSETG